MATSARVTPRCGTGSTTLVPSCRTVDRGGARSTVLDERDGERNRTYGVSVFAVRDLTVDELMQLAAVEAGGPTAEALRAELLTEIRSGAGV